MYDELATGFLFGSTWEFAGFCRSRLMPSGAGLVSVGDRRMALQGP